jgi:hypothetical protein
MDTQPFHMASAAHLSPPDNSRNQQTTIFKQSSLNLLSRALAVTTPSSFTSFEIRQDGGKCGACLLHQVSSGLIAYQLGLKLGRLMHFTFDAVLGEQSPNAYNPRMSC